MPVPVPRTAKAQAHPVIKPYHRVRGQSLSESNFSALLPHPPLGLHLSSGPYEEWASALPSWRRNQQRPFADEDARPKSLSTLQDFHQGLTVADNASVIKGTRAEACFPPSYNPLQIQQIPAVKAHSREPQAIKRESDYTMESGFSAHDQAQFDNSMRWDVDFLVGREGVDGTPEDGLHRATDGSSPAQMVTDSASIHNRSYQMGAFSPIYEDQSPGSASGQDDNSSPLEPSTPFGDFVDRAVAYAEPYPTSFLTQYAEQSATADYYQTKQANLETCQAPPVFPTLAEPPKEQEPLQDTITPSPAVSFKTLSEPLSKWVAAYVWKVCTTGFSLPLTFAQPALNATPYPAAAPSYLAPSIHSLLLSTLLQPSCVLLAVWYIVRLPVYFGAAPLAAEKVNERLFRSVLLGDESAGFESDASEASAAFRLVVLGCMLANKWLDDHTFSNKTWHSISNIPIQTLNKLESLILDIFSYDLSISSQQWSRWLVHVMAYHMSLSSPTYPQPISRPSSNPHSIVRRAIDEIIRVPSTFKVGSQLPQPVFIGFEERLRERSEKENALDVLEIDLDEDGPLREEYLPKRRASKLTSQNSQTRHGSGLSQGQPLGIGKWNIQDVPPIKALPPPAKWSPAGDEPILRDRNRVSGQYVAVQAPAHPMAPYAASYHTNIVYNNQNWDLAGGYMPVKAQPVYIHDMSSMFQMSQPAYNPFGPIPTLAIPHSRSQSLSYDQDTSRNHTRSYLQSRFEYRNSDFHMMPNEHAPFKDAASKWMDQSAGYLAPSQAYIHIPSVGMQPTW